MRLPRLQYRLSTLLGVVMLVALGLGFVQTWLRSSAAKPRGSHPIASKVLAMRSAKPTPVNPTTGDPILLAGFVAVAFVVSSLRGRRRGLESSGLDASPHGPRDRAGSSIRTASAPTGTIQDRGDP